MMSKSDKLYMLALAMVILASAEVNITGMIGAVLQFVWSALCVAIAYVLVKKSELFRKENE